MLLWLLSLFGDLEDFLRGDNLLEDNVLEAARVSSLLRVRFESILKIWFHFMHLL